MFVNEKMFDYYYSIYNSKIMVKINFIKCMVSLLKALYAAKK